MKIIQFSDSFLPVMDGVGNVTYKYAKCFGEKGHESYVVAPQKDTGYRGNFPFEIIDYIGIPLAGLKSYDVGLPALDNNCRNRLRMIDADIVHVHSPFIAGHAGIAYAQKRDIPVVGMFHSKYYDDFLQITGMELLADVGVKYVVDFYEKCDEVWAVSRSSAEVLHSYGYEGEIQVIPNGTDIPTLISDVDVDAEYGTKGENVLLFVGQLNRKKNIQCIMEAVSLLKVQYKLILAGQGPHEKEFRKLADELNIADKVVFTGHISDPAVLNALYKRADLFLFPSLYDTSGLVVREAAAVGTPSVVVRGSSASECISDGKNGFLCDNTPESLAETVERVLGSKNTLSVVGTSATAQIPIPWTAIADRVLERYEGLLCDRRK